MPIGDALDGGSSIATMLALAVAALACWFALRSARAAEESARAGERSAQAAEESARAGERSAQAAEESATIERGRWSHETEVRQRAKLVARFEQQSGRRFMVIENTGGSPARHLLLQFPLSTYLAMTQEAAATVQMAVILPGRSISLQLHTSMGPFPNGPIRLHMWWEDDAGAHQDTAQLRM
ncbi:hypothetical protein [Streptomyces sp. BPTC-684]|uniref:hypothetical protein n=1 Tax=Streptomyces sp. BPTC-684 TaxID=3043734 RepID=UPI0024B274BC|nr:hypothetical protein [Streptomyces sp. BPTC-684]WHM36317.1 hypothetical protein QIY60_04805 [Streptomyces sp. BPTC-684]